MNTIRERGRAIGRALAAALTRLGRSKKPVDVNDPRPLPPVDTNTPRG